MKTSFICIVSLLSLTAACNKGPNESDGKAVVDKVEAFHQQVCACKDADCATKVKTDFDAYMKSGAIKKPTDKQMSDVMKSEHAFDDCAKKLILDEVGTLMLKQLTDGLKEAHEKAAKEYSSAGFKCSLSDLQKFKTDYAGVAAGAQAAFVKEYEDYCTTGLHLEAAEAAVKNAEATKDCGSANLVLAEVKLKDVPGGVEKLAPLKERWTAAGCH